MEPSVTPVRKAPVRQRQRPLGPLRSLERGLSRFRAHPLRSALVGLLSLLLVWLVLTRSLPFALAPGNPDLALALNPNNPAALIAKADQIRERLHALSGALPLTAQGQAGGFPQSANTLTRLPEAASSGSLEELDGEREALRKEIGQLAARTIENDPLNPEAFRLLAETANETVRVRILMREAARRSRREAIALFWLLNDSFYRKDYQTALDWADILLRTRPELSDYVLNYVALIAEDAGALPLVVRALAKRPGWRGQFLKALPRTARQTDLPLKLMIALKNEGEPPSGQELAPYLDVLINHGRADAAYNAWLQLLPAAELSGLGLLTNAGFERSPSGLPFDWRIAPGLNAIAELVPACSNCKDRLLHISFGSGRVKFPELSQIVLLAPGRYRLEAKVRGQILGKRGLRWQLQCAGGTHRLLGESDMLMGETQQWRVFSLDAEVKQGGDCAGQALRLFHDSRSASEEFISGEVWFGGLRLQRITAGDTAAN